MTRWLILALSLTLACSSDKETSPAPADQPAAAPTPAAGAPTAAPAPSPAQPTTEESGETPAAAGDGAPAMDEVHALLKAGKKVEAVRQYRNLHDKLALNASSLGVDVEATRIGLPSMDRARTLYFEGKGDDEILAVLDATYGAPKTKTSADTRKLLLADIKKMGPATEANLKAKVAAGETTAALAIYHYLHPEVSIPDAWQAVTAMKTP